MIIKQKMRYLLTGAAVLAVSGTILSGCSLLNYGQGNTNPNLGSSISGNGSNLITTQDNGHVLSEETLDKIDLIAAYINNLYLYDVDEEGLSDAIYAAVMDYLDEPYSCYYDAEQYASLMEATEGTYCGIGATMLQNMEDMRVQILYTFSNSPAKEAGIMDGDYLVGVDDYDISEMELSEIVGYIRGEEGTTVDITIYRQSTEETITYTITRRTIEIDTVSYEMLEDNIGYICILEFEELTTKQFMAALEDLQSQGMEALILDLRDNPGGVVDAAVGVASAFIDGETVAYTENKSGQQYVYTAEEGISYEGDMVVLLNENSASASELLTGALQDYGLATVMGTQSFGKGIVQGVYGLGDGTGLKLTTSNYFTPNGNNIHGIGITPDIAVEADSESEYDVQLQEAIEYLTGESY